MYTACYIEKNLRSKVQLSEPTLLVKGICSVHCKNFMVVLTNKDGYLSCTFVHWTLATEQSYTKNA